MYIYVHITHLHIRDATPQGKASSLPWPIWLAQCKNPSSTVDHSCPQLMVTTVTIYCTELYDIRYQLRCIVIKLDDRYDLYTIYPLAMTNSLLLNMVIEFP